MAITDIGWDGEGYDIHLLKGEKSIPLAGKLNAERNNSSTFDGNNPPPGVTVEFIADFKGAPSNHSVTVSSAGQVEVTALPSPRLHNFILRAIVKETGSNQLETRIRIHIHEKIKKIWLTPDTLSLYVGGGKQRFTVLGEFDDGTFGDITDRNSTVAVNSRNQLAFKRVPAATNNVTVDPSTGELEAVTANTQQEIRVEILLDATTPGLPDEQQSGAIVNTKPALGSPRKITRVRPIGPPNFTEKTNILFLPDGFQIGERDLFNKLLDKIVNQLQTGTATFPYKALKGSMNYWRLEDADFFASVDQGVSLLAELDTVGRRISSGKLVPFPVKPPSTASSWGLEHLVFVLGLPVPSDTRTLTQLKTLYDNIVDSKIKTKVFNEWRALGDRKLINERDTAFGIALNNHPRADLDADRLATFHDRRTTGSQFKAFVASLKDGTTVVGDSWTTGKDKGLICLVTRSGRTGGTRSDDVFCFTLGENTEDKLQPATGGRRGIDLIPLKLTDARGNVIDLSPGVVATLAHECAHAFGLKDEYGGGLQLPPAARIELISSGNVQPAGEIRHGLSTAIEQDLIRWKLPRIKAAGVLSATPAPSGGNFVITLVTARAGDFKKDDIVRLRKRDFLTDQNLNSGPFRVHEIQFDSTISINPFVGTTLAPGEFPAGSKLIATNTGNIAVTATEPQPSALGGSILDVELRAGHGAGVNTGNVVVLRKNAFSERFKVAADPQVVGVPGGDPWRGMVTITITPIGGATASGFVAGDVLIATVPASLSPLGDDLPLIAPTILRHIGDKAGPLNAPRGSPTRACVAASSPISLMTPGNLPSRLPKGRPANKANIVGLYEGGAGYDCGIFHPAGQCIMRTNIKSRTARFCHVCRYLIIDRVDPIRHKELDAIYQGEYPEP